MSYCSDLTKERIMECAKAEFLKKGFQAAQLKDIVTAAKVTTGAVYRHFKDKEALFLALIEDVYHYTLDFMDNAEPYDKVGIREAIERDSVEASYMQAMTYINYMYDHLEEFQLLLKCSKGSRVENFIEEASNPVPTPLLGHRCRSSQEITGSPTPFSTSNHYLWICASASFSLSNPNIAA